MGNNPINGMDVDGGFFLPGAVIGGLANGIINIVSQANNGELEWSWKSVGRVALAVGGGALAGGTGNLAFASATNMVSEYGDQLIANDFDSTKIKYGRVLTSGIVTAGSGYLINNITKSNNLIMRVVHKYGQKYIKIKNRPYYKSTIGMQNAKAEDYFSTTIGTFIGYENAKFNRYTDNLTKDFEHLFDQQLSFDIQQMIINDQQTMFFNNNYNKSVKYFYCRLIMIGIEE